MSKYDCIKRHKKTEEEIKKTRNFDKVEFLDLSKPGIYKVRFVGLPYAFRVPKQEENGTMQRFATYVFDRNDNNKLKVLEKGSQLFEQVGMYAAITGNKPSSIDNAPNFKIRMVFKAEEMTHIKMFMSEVRAEKEICPLTLEEIQRFGEDSADLSEYFGWSGNRYRKEYHG